MLKRKSLVVALLSLTLLLGLIATYSLKDDKNSTFTSSQFLYKGVACENDSACFKNFLDFSRDRSSNKELIVNLLLWNEEYGKSILRSFMEVPEFKNDCYSTLGEAGSEFAKQKGIEAVKFELAICRSAFKLGILEGLKGQIPVEKSKEYIAHLCDQDPEKNGCTDGVGRLAYFYGFSAKESSELCKVGEVGVAEIETYFEGCMGGYGNWSRFGSFWANYSTINDVFTKYCLGVDERGLSSCLGYGMRSYVRFGLVDGSAEGRLNEFYEVCRTNREINDFCGIYLGFVLADVYNDKYGKTPILEGAKMASKLDRYCKIGKPNDCYSSFVAWYLNQWTFSSKDGKFAKEETLAICTALANEDNRDFCRKRVAEEEKRYDGRLVNASNE